MPTPIDIVIPHVDGAAPGYEALCRRHTGDFVPCHVRDLGELRYVLRSLDEHAPWARVVLVVQGRAHLPAWLSAASIRVIEHDEFIPASLLPTFHWATIVAHLHLISDLSERYVIWEDDVLLGARLAEGELFDEEGLPLTGMSAFPILPGLERIGALGAYQANLTQSRALLLRAARRRDPRAASPPCFVYPHVPLPVHRPSWAEHFAELIVDPVYEDTVTRRCRGDERGRATIDPGVVFANWMESEKRRRGALRRYLSCAGQLLTRTAQGLPGAGSSRRFGHYAVVNDPHRMDRNMKRLLAERPTFINVNDEAYDAWTEDPTGHALNPRSVESLQRSLAQLYPRPSRHEAALAPAAPAEQARP